MTLLFTLKLAERCSSLGEALMLVSGTVRYWPGPGVSFFFSSKRLLVDTAMPDFLEAGILAS